MLCRVRAVCVAAVQCLCAAFVQWLCVAQCACSGCVVADLGAILVQHHERSERTVGAALHPRPAAVGLPFLFAHFAAARRLLQLWRHGWWQCAPLVETIVHGET
eukprot:scaffold74414_cov97-Phaeocystis_antarctica.AAC.4